MKYQVHILPAAEKDVKRLPSGIRARVSKKILSLEDNPRPRGVKKLSGREEYRIRIADYRVLYTIDDKNCIVTIAVVGHRREVYRAE